MGGGDLVSLNDLKNGLSFLRKLYSNMYVFCIEYEKIMASALD